ncbi:MAG TPA: hypothetical protein VFY25_01055 [Anaerolineales bacterium]|nr:hypothetical protein [Anaerolineales bacterium]
MKTYFIDRRAGRVHSSGLILAVMTLLSMAAIGCTPPSTPTQTSFATSIGSCFPASVFTQEDMSARVQCHPDQYKIEVDNDTVVLFAFPDPIIDWVGPVFIIHIPSVSEVVLSSEGSILFDDYKSPEGRSAIENVLENQELMSRILEQAKEIARKP